MQDGHTVWVLGWRCVDFPAATNGAGRIEADGGKSGPWPDERTSSKGGIGAKARLSVLALCDALRMVSTPDQTWFGFPPGSIGVRIEQLDILKQQAIEMCEQNRAARSLQTAGDLQPAGDRAD